MAPDSTNLTFFSEDRLERDMEGRPASFDSWLAGGGWARGLASRNGAQFAARVDDARRPGLSPVAGVVVPLTHYQGFGIARNLGWVVRDIFLAVRSSKAIAVRLPGPIGTMAVAAAVALNRRIVVELVGDVEEVLRTGVAGRGGSHLARRSAAVTRWAVKRGHVVRYVTEEQLQAIYPPSPSARVLGFSDVVLEEEDFAESRTPPGGRPTVIAIGSHEQRYKGHDVLIEAVARLTRYFPDVSCVIVGTGRYHDELKVLTKRLGLDDNVEFRGHLSSRADVRAALDRSWVFAMPSKTEGLPRALLEAMARGLPCVGTRVGGIPELLNDDMLVEPGDVIGLEVVLRQLLGDDALRAEQGRRNFQKAVEVNRRVRAGTAEWHSILEQLTVAKGDGADARLS